MEVKNKAVGTKGFKLFIEINGKELARAYLYVLKNNLHRQPFGLMEDVFVAEECRGKGIGSELVKQVIVKAISMDCYKLICTSRHSKPKVHELYLKLGFKDHGREFRLDF